MPPLDLATTAPPATLEHDSRSQVPRVALVITAYEDEPWRIGEVAFVSPATRCIGRGGLPIEEFASFSPQRPGDAFPEHAGIAGCLTGAGVSRRLCKVKLTGFGVEIENRSGRPMLVNGEAVDRATLTAKDHVTFIRGVSFMCLLRPAAFPALRHARVAHPFGEPDAAGNVGEGLAMWAARDEATRLGRGTDLVLIFGESGTGKTGMARMIHQTSRCASGPFIAEDLSQATETLFQSLLFGKVANFPTPGPAMAGILPSAQGGTALLDEIGDLSIAAQKYLRTTLEKGSYKRLGEDVWRLLEVRILGATNLSRSALQPDFHPRFRADMRLLPLRERPEDIPLLVRDLLRRRLKTNDDLARFFWKGPDGALYPRISVKLMDFLVRHELLGNARELDLLLGAAIGESHGDRIMMFAEPRSLKSIRPAASGPAASGPMPSGLVPSGPWSSGPVSPPVSSAKAGTTGDALPDKETILAALVAVNWNVTRAAVVLRLQRNKLIRLMVSMGLKKEKDEEKEEEEKKEEDDDG